MTALGVALLSTGSLYRRIGNRLMLLTKLLAANVTVVIAVRVYVSREIGKHLFSADLVSANLTFNNKLIRATGNTVTDNNVFLNSRHRNVAVAGTAGEAAGLTLLDACASAVYVIVSKRLNSNAFAIKGSKAFFISEKLVTTLAGIVSSVSHRITGGISCLYKNQLVLMITVEGIILSYLIG
jgi:hypothetical protein